MKQFPVERCKIVRENCKPWPKDVMWSNKSSGKSNAKSKSYGQSLSILLEIIRFCQEHFIFTLRSLWQIVLQPMIMRCLQVGPYTLFS